MARMRAVINSIKHYVNFENTEVASATRREFKIVHAVAQNAVTDLEDVTEGSIVKAIFVEIWIHSKATAGLETKFQLVLEKIPAGQDPIGFASMNTLMGYQNKKNVFFFSQGVLGDLTTQAVPVIRQWFKIPKGKQRMGLGDKIQVAVGATGFTIDSCGFSTYKEYN